MSDEVFWTRFISVVVILGVLKAFIFPFIFPSVFIAPWMKGIGIAFNLFFHLAVLAGFVYFLIRGGKFKRKEFSTWTVVGIVMIGFSVLPLIQRIYVGSYFTNPWKVFLSEIMTLSEVSFYGIGFGLWVGFFELENRKELLLFLIPLSLAWAIGFLPFSLFYHLHWSSFGLGYGLDKGYAMLPYGFRLWIFPKCMWNMWFWGELLVRYPLALFVLWRLFNVHVKNLKFMKKSQKLSYGE